MTLGVVAHRQAVVIGRDLDSVAVAVLALDEVLDEAARLPALEGPQLLGHAVGAVAGVEDLAALVLGRVKAGLVEAPFEDGWGLPSGS